MSREPRAVLLLLGLAVLGHGIRLLLQPRAAPPGELFASKSAALDPARQKARAEQAVRPLGRAERIDLNTASAVEIARLPRVGMSLAKRIVADRAARGSFRGLSELDRVPGVGPSLLALLGNRVVFGGVATPNPAPGRNDANTRTTGVYGAETGPVTRSRIELNSASLADLLALPGIGKARALAILAYRRDNGPFAAVSDLERVPGISQALAARLAPFLVIR